MGEKKKEGEKKSCSRTVRRVGRKHEEGEETRKTCPAPPFSLLSLLFHQQKNTRLHSSPHHARTHARTHACTHLYECVLEVFEGARALPHTAAADDGDFHREECEVGKKKMASVGFFFFFFFFCLFFLFHSILRNILFLFLPLSLSLSLAKTISFCCFCSHAFNIEPNFSSLSTNCNWENRKKKNPYEESSYHTYQQAHKTKAKGKKKKTGNTTSNRCSALELHLHVVQLLRQGL